MWDRCAIQRLKLVIRCWLADWQAYCMWRINQKPSVSTRACRHSWSVQFLDLTLASTGENSWQSYLTYDTHAPFDMHFPSRYSNCLLLKSMYAGCPVVLPREAECVLLGAAIIGAVAAKKFVSINSAMESLNASGLVSKQILNGWHHEVSLSVVPFFMYCIQMY